MEVIDVIHDLEMIEEYAAAIRMRLEKGLNQNLSQLALAAIVNSKHNIKIAIHYSNYGE